MAAKGSTKDPDFYVVLKYFFYSLRIIWRKGIEQVQRNVLFVLLMNPLSISLLSALLQD
jgi:hypothetical protein